MNNRGKLIERIVTINRRQHNNFSTFALLFTMFFWGAIFVGITMGLVYANYVYVLIVVGLGGLVTAFFVPYLVVRGWRGKYLEVWEKGIVWPYVRFGDLMRNLEGEFIPYSTIRYVPITKQKKVLVMTQKGRMEVQRKYILNIWTLKKRKKFGITSWEIGENGIEELERILRRCVGEEKVVVTEVD